MCWVSPFCQISLGTVTNVEDAVRWLSYTYLYVRMRVNPMVYGISHDELQVTKYQVFRVNNLLQGGLVSRPY